MSRYKFDSIKTIAKLQDMQVIVISGSHNIFVDMIAQDVRHRPDIETNISLKLNTGLNTEFETIDEREMSLDLDTFFKVCTSKSPLGKWLCRVDYDIVTKKDRDRIKNYIKKPSENAMLIVTVAEYKNVKELRSLRSLTSSKVSHSIDIQYPRRDILKGIVEDKFKEYGYYINEQSTQLFIMKMGSAYDEYYTSIETIIERIKATASTVEAEADIKEAEDKEKLLNTSDEENRTKRLINIDSKDFKAAMQGIDFFVIDDFLRELIKPLHNNKIVKRRKAYRILDTLLNDYTAREICKKLKYKVEELLYYRAYINKGFIPVRTRYNADVVKERLPEDSKLRKATSLSFKRNAYLASMTSVEDWFYIYSLLNRNSESDSEGKFFATLLAVMGRTAMSNDRLMNSIRVKNTLSEGLYDVNSIFYSTWWQSLKRTNERSS